MLVVPPLRAQVLALTQLFIVYNVYVGCTLQGLLFMHMTGLLPEGIFHVEGLLQPAFFGSSPWAYVMCNWALTTEELEKRGGSDGWGVGVVVARRNVCDYVPHGS